MSFSVCVCFISGYIAWNKSYAMLYYNQEGAYRKQNMT